MEQVTAQDHRNWPVRHWKLLVAGGVLLVAAGGTSFCLMVFSLMRNSTAAQMALATAKENPALIAEIGQPMQPGWLVSGSIEVSANKGSADLSIPLSGPKGSGTLYLEAEKHAGLWKLELLQFGGKGSSERLDLLTAAQETPAPVETVQ